MKPVAVYTDNDDTDLTLGIKLLEEAGYEVRLLGTRDPARIVKEAADATVLLPGYAEITAEVINALPNLRLISLMSMGTNNVDLQAAFAKNVLVTNVPGAATEEVATHALTLTLAVLRQLPFYQASATPERWNERAALPPQRVSELTLGIYGLGRIGQQFAKLASPLFGRVIGYDPYLPDTPETQAVLAACGITRVDQQTVVAEANVFSLHLPLTPETTGFVDAALIAQLPTGAVLVNVSRGGLLDENAVAAALESGQLGGCALDVLATEPPAATNPLLGRDNVVITPHIAYYSSFTEMEYVRVQAQNAVSLLSRGEVDTPVPGSSRVG